jgi:hypothetical protein
MVRHVSYTVHYTHYTRYRWCVMSAPLYLGFDLTDTVLRAKMWPIVGNAEAIAVNQQCKHECIAVVVVSLSPPSSNIGLSTPLGPRLI